MGKPSPELTQFRVDNLNRARALSKGSRKVPKLFKEIIRSIFEDPTYLANLRKRVLNGTENARVVVHLMSMVYGKPKEQVEITHNLEMDLIERIGRATAAARLEAKKKELAPAPVEQSGEIINIVPSVLDKTSNKAPE